MNIYTYLVENNSQLQDELQHLSVDGSCNYLVQCFSTQSRQTVSDLLATVQNKIPTSSNIGTSVTHFIYKNRTINHGTLITITELQHSTFSTALVLRTNHLAEEGETLYKRLSINDTAKAVISFADGVDATDSSLYSAFTKANPSLHLAGGVSTPNDFGNWVLLNGDFFEKACVAVVFKGDDLTVWGKFFHEWNPIGKEFTVTEVQGERIISLDHNAPLELYQHYLSEGQPVTYQEIKEFPLMSAGSKKQTIYIPVSVSDDGSMTFNGHVEVGDKLRFCYDHPSLTIQQVRGMVAQLKQAKPQAVFYYNCLSRLDFMDGDVELEKFDNLMSSSGAYCMGELARVENRAQILHHSFTVLALREGKVETTSPNSSIQPLAEADDLRGITPLFSLIKNALADLDYMQSEMEQTIRKQSQRLFESYQTDRRTSLPNRNALKESLKDIGADEHLIVIKMVNFAQINERYGYQVGDQLLMDLTQHFLCLLRGIISPHTLYSLGVAEWAVLVDSKSSKEELMAFFIHAAEDTENVNFEPMGLPDLDHLSVSIRGGIISRRDFPSENPDEFLLKSIEARRKAQKLQEYACDASSLIGELNRRQEQFNWLTCVSRAVVNEKVVAYAQPIVEAKTHKTICQECLVRIEEDGNVLLPGHFLPMISGTHLYSRLSRQMISRSFEAMKDSETAFSINLSPEDFMNDKTILHLEKAISAFPHPNRVGLEVLETEKIRDYGRMIEVCEHFKQMGARIIVDDFGTGYSNIEEIIKLEPNIIKLDGSLIRNIDTDKKQRAIAQQLVNLCKVFNAQTVAEFVHNQKVCELAEEMGVDYLQGYYFSPPKPI